MTTEKKDVNEVFQSSFSQLFGALTKWYPPVDMQDTKQSIIVRMGIYLSCVTFLLRCILTVYLYSLF